MLDIDEINRAIAELEAGKTSATSCAKLADLYAVRDHTMKHEPEEYFSGYSRAAESPMRESSHPDVAAVYGDSDFLNAVSGKDLTAAWKVVDGLMETLRVVNPRVYDSVIRKMRQI